MRPTSVQISEREGRECFGFIAYAPKMNESLQNVSSSPTSVLYYNPPPRLRVFALARLLNAFEVLPLHRAKVERLVDALHRSMTSAEKATEAESQAEAASTAKATTDSALGEYLFSAAAIWLVTKYEFDCPPHPPEARSLHDVVDTMHQSMQYDVVDGGALSYAPLQRSNRVLRQHVIRAEAAILRLIDYRLFAVLEERSCSMHRSAMNQERKCQKIRDVFL